MHKKILPGFNIQVRAIVKDSHGKVIKRYPWRRANSLLKNFSLLLYLQMSQSATVTITDTGGTPRSCAPNAIVFESYAGAGDTGGGIVIGTGATAVAMTDTKLVTQVTTNITHSVVLTTSWNPFANTWGVLIVRTFTNATGGNLNIKEVGLYLQSYAGGNRYICCERSLYNVTVANNASVIFTYGISVSL